MHYDIAARLERFSKAVAEGKSPRLMVLMPPRHGKSELASRMFPAWHLGHYPDHEFIACSYNVALAMSFSRKVKDTLNDSEYQNVFQARLNPDHMGAEEWSIAGTRGGYVAAGVGGGINGKGAHVLVIDDPFKNAEEADSPDQRQKVWEWYGSTAYTRLAPGGGILVIQTWWNDDDLAGRLQRAMTEDFDENSDQWEIIKYPAIAEEDEWLDIPTNQPLHIEHSSLNEKLTTEERLTAAGYDLANVKFLRKKGDALHEARFDLPKLLKIKKTLPNRFWSALYQQNPVPDDGEYFTQSQFRRKDSPALIDSNPYIAFDFAIGEKQGNDYTVGTAGLQDWDDELHVVDMIRFKNGNAFQIVEAICNFVTKWYSPRLILGFEDGQIYRAISALLAKRFRERHITVHIEVLKPITDKLARARPLQARMEQGMVSFDGHSSANGWYEIAKGEMLRFPVGTHDDCVDALAWMTTLVIGHQPPMRPREIRPKSWKDKLSGRPGTGTVGHMAA